MPLTPEDAQKLNNLQQRILRNIAEGNPSHHNITEEEIKESLQMLRGDRAKAVAAGAEKKPRAKKEKASPASSGLPLESALQGKFAGLDLD